MKSKMTEFNKVVREIKRDHKMRMKGFEVEVKPEWLPSFDFSARIALLKDGVEVDHGCLLEHQFFNGERFGTIGFEKGLIELASDTKAHTGDEVLEIWRRYA